MDQPNGSDNRAPDFKIVVVAIAIAAISAFMLAQFRDDRREPRIIIVDPQEESTIVVSVEGAVATPGVYDLPGSARVRDALEAAGGPRQDADLREVNLAARLRDEARVFVPGAVAESQPLTGTETPPTPIQPPSAVIDLNRATAEELEALPGIGSVLAARIVGYREEHGPYQSVEELDEIEGISRRMVDELRPLVTVES